MKYAVKTFKTLGAALKELEPFVRDGEHLQTGRPFEKFDGMRSREMLANWLVCAAINSTGEKELTFSSDPIGGDGIIVDVATHDTWPTEHVMVPRSCGGPGTGVDTLILEAVEQKRGKGGSAYARGKTLVLFLNAAGEPWHPNKVARKLPDPLHFAAVWVVALQHAEKTGEYVYGVTLLDATEGDAPTFLVRIAADFATWRVDRHQ